MNLLSLCSQLLWLLFSASLVCVMLHRFPAILDAWTRARHASLSQPSPSSVRDLDTVRLRVTLLSSGEVLVEGPFMKQDTPHSNHDTSVEPTLSHPTPDVSAEPALPEPVSHASERRTPPVKKTVSVPVQPSVKPTSTSSEEEVSPSLASGTRQARRRRHAAKPPLPTVPRVAAPTRIWTRHA